MKHLILGLSLSLTGLLMVLIIMTHTGQMDRQSELDTVLSEACENALSETMGQFHSYEIEPTQAQLNKARAELAVEGNHYNETPAMRVKRDELIAAFLQNLSMGLDSNATLQVDILNVDAVRGLLKVKVTAKYRNPKGNVGEYESTCTVVLDQDLRYRQKCDTYYVMPVADDPTTLVNERELFCDETEDYIQTKVDTEYSDFKNDIWKKVKQPTGEDYIIPESPTMEDTDEYRYEFEGWYNIGNNMFADASGNIKELNAMYSIVNRDDTVFFARFKKIKK